MSKTKSFMVVELPKENGSADNMLSEPAHFNSYDDAFDALNEVVAYNHQQIFKQPKGENPIRVSLKDRDVELWVITRTGELLTQ